MIFTLPDNPIEIGKMIKAVIDKHNIEIQFIVSNTAIPKSTLYTIFNGTGGGIGHLCTLFAFLEAETTVKFQPDYSHLNSKK